jgi:transcription antitermination factor NusA-like protein
LEVRRMLRKLVYKGDRKFLILHPVNELVEKNTEITVNNKEIAKQLQELGFEEVAEGKEEIEKIEEKEGEE